ncbi:hypothetical protein AB5I41_04645 [Sphingomonas sp. MMS24-JH45]
MNPPVLDRTRGRTSERNWKKPALPERHEAIDTARLDVEDVVDKRRTWSCFERRVVRGISQRRSA